MEPENVGGRNRMMACDSSNGTEKMPDQESQDGMRFIKISGGFVYGSKCTNNREF